MVSLDIRVALGRPIQNLALGQRLPLILLWLARVLLQVYALFDPLLLSFCDPLVDILIHRCAYSVRRVASALVQEAVLVIVFDLRLEVVLIDALFGIPRVQCPTCLSASARGVVVPLAAIARSLRQVYDIRDAIDDAP